MVFIVVDPGAGVDRGRVCALAPPLKKGDGLAVGGGGGHVLGGEGVQRGVRGVQPGHLHVGQGGGGGQGQAPQVTVRQAQRGAAEGAQSIQVEAVVLYLLPQVP